MSGFGLRRSVSSRSLSLTPLSLFLMLRIVPSEFDSSFISGTDFGYSPLPTVHDLKRADGSPPQAVLNNKANSAFSSPRHFTSLAPIPVSRLQRLVLDNVVVIINSSSRRTRYLPRLQTS